MDNLVLIGFMGVGKDLVAKELEKKTNYSVYSTDRYIEYYEGKTITEIFNTSGESYFRKLETLTLERIKDLKNIVVSTGGGIVISEKNRKILSKIGRIVHLKCDINEIKKRLENNNNRPLLKKENLTNLFNNRERIYDFADFEIDTTGKTPPEIANIIMEKLQIAPIKKPRLFQRIKIKTKQKNYPVYIGENIIENISEFIKEERKAQGRFVIISNHLVSTLFLDKFLSILKKSHQTLSFIIPEGEENKNLETVKKIYDFLLENNINRGDALISLGGGVVGDISGFIASTFKRGMRSIQIPTTLLAQVDASVGGKTGINHKEGKNMIGSFYQPDMVIEDIGFLRTLPEHIYKEGISEIIKYGIIKGRELFSILKSEKQKIVERDSEILSEIISRSVKIKGEVVSMDEREESGIREILNFGHTIAHAIETLTEYGEYSHGEAVAIGMKEEVMRAREKGLVEEKELLNIINLIKDYGLPHSLPKSISRKAIIEKLLQDKKVRNGKIKIPIPLKIGKTIIKEVLCEDYL